MAGDFEERLRQALRLRAAEIEPDPRLWRRVSDRITHRGRWNPLLVATGAVAVVVLTVLMGTDALRPTGQVELSPAGQPPEEAGTQDDPEGPGQCSARGRLVAVYQETGGTLTGACDNGEAVAIASDEGIAEPAFAPDGERLAYSRQAADGTGEVVVLDLETGNQTVVGPGSAPALAPDGRLARVVAPAVASPPSGARPPSRADASPTGEQPVRAQHDGPGGSAPQVVVTAGEDGEQIESFPALDTVYGPVRVSRPLWSADGRFLSYHVSPVETEGSLEVIAAFDGDRAAGTGSVMAPDQNQGGQLVGSSVAGPETLLTLWRCCTMTEGEAASRAELRLYTHRFTAEDASRPTVTEHVVVADLAEVDGFDVNADPATYTLQPAGSASAERVGERVRWRQGEQPAFLVGDGSSLWLVEGGAGERGEVTLVADGAVRAAVNPAAFPTAPLPVPEEAVPGEQPARPPEPDVDPDPTREPEPSPSPSPPPLAEVQVYFARPELDEQCDATWAFPRRVRPPSVARGALQELLSGPTEEEAAQGATSVFGPHTAGLLRDLRLDTDGTMYVMFADFREVLPEVSTSCGGAAFLSQLDNTLQQFPTVQHVRYSIEGDQAAFYEFLQRPVPG